MHGPRKGEINCRARRETILYNFAFHPDAEKREKFLARREVAAAAESLIYYRAEVSSGNQQLGKSRRSAPSKLKGGKKEDIYKSEVDSRGSVCVYVCVYIYIERRRSCRARAR